MKQELLAIEDFARQAHAGQFRKFENAPYIVHPIRVMNICKEYDNSLPVLAAALLHDVLEDTKVSKEELQVFLDTVFDTAASNSTLLLVDQLTDRYTRKEYPGWNRRKRKTKEAERMVTCSAKAHTIKYADIIDNLDSISGSGDEFEKKYISESFYLLKHMVKGNEDLHARAIAKVKESLVAIYREA